MAAVTGGFILPSAQRTSQLVNDTRFSSIREYILDSNTLVGSTQLDISDLASSSVIYRIDLIVMSAFSNAAGDQHDITISSDSGGILMDAIWNDPNTIGSYSTNCYATVRRSDDLVHVNHTLTDMITGSAILRLYIYNNIDEYQRLLTADDKFYLTADGADVNVKI